MKEYRKKKDSANFIFIFLFMFILRLESILVSAKIKANNFKQNNTYNNEDPSLQMAPIVLKRDFSPYLERTDNLLTSPQLPIYAATKPDYEIKSLSHTFTIDPQLKSCDINVLEKIRFNLPEKSNTLNYIIISKKIPLFEFYIRVVKVYDKDLAVIGSKVKDVKLFKDASFKSRTFIDSEVKKVKFRDRWLVNVEFSNPVKDIELEISYKMQRALLIDSSNKSNFLKLDLINPNTSNIDNYKLMIVLKNYKELSAGDLKMPIGTFATQKENDILITNNQSFAKYSEFEIDFSLPYEISACEGDYINLVYYGLIAMSIIFVLMSVFTIAYLYKE